MISEKPHVINDLLDINQEKIGYLVQYEVEMVSEEHLIQNDSEEDFIVETTITSLLTFLYNEKESVMEVLLVDYSSIESEGIIYLRNFTSDVVEEILLADSSNKGLKEMSSDVKKSKDMAVAAAKQNIGSGKVGEDAELNPDYLPGCRYWYCSEFITGGGDYHGNCSALAGGVCGVTGAFTRVGSAICYGSSLLGCYVPKYKQCVRGYWLTKNCPIQS